MGETAFEHPTLRIKRAQTHRSLERLDRKCRAVRKTLDPSVEIPGESGIGIEFKSPLDRAQAGSALAGQDNNGPAAHPQRVRVFFSRPDRPGREANALGNVLFRVA